MSHSTSDNPRPVPRNFLLRMFYFFAWFASVTIVASILLIMNSLITWAVLGSFDDKTFASAGGEKVMQAIMMIVPVALVFIQFRIYDFLVDIVSSWRRRQT